MAERFVAVDTNVLLDEELGEEDVVDALAIMRKRISGSQFVVTPTVLHELALLASCDDDPETRAIAASAAQNLLTRGYQPLNLIPAGHGIVAECGLKMRIQGILPDQEENDGLIIALIGASILLSSDGHMLDAQESGQLQRFLSDCSVPGDKLLIATPLHRQ